MDYEPLPGASAQPRAPDPPGDPALLWGNASEKDCVHQRGESTGLMPRPDFPSKLGTAADLAALVDSTMCREFKVVDIGGAFLGGAAVAIVDSERIAFSSGYFYSDVNQKTAVDPATTPFRIGSISKLFTFTALMQLRDRGRVDLTADINKYLGNSPAIPDTFEQPVTLKNLMTHTAGLEENLVGIGFATRPEDLVSVGETVNTHVPARVRAPATDFTHGEQSAYSNWGAALAGYIVERQSGETYDNYVERHIFEPLGMKHSSFREPLPSQLADQVSLGYRREDYTACGFEYIHGFAPVGSGSASAEDMARFMSMHLQNGRFGNAQVLQEQSALAMHGRAFSPHANVAGSGYGFMERYINGHRMLWHSGLTDCFYAELFLFPEEKIGLVVLYNTLPRSKQTGELAQRFMDHYFPAQPLPTMAPAKGDAERLAQYQGYYRSNSRAVKTWEKIFDLTAAYELSVTKDGALSLPWVPGLCKAADWIAAPTQPLVFRCARSEETAAIVESADGNTYVLGPWPFAPMIKLGWLDSPPFNEALVAFFLVAFEFAIAFAMVVWVQDWLWGAYRKEASLAAATGAVNLGILELLNWAYSHTPDVTLAVPLTVRVAMGLTLVSAVLTLWLLIAAASVWQPHRPSSQRHFVSALALPAVIFQWWLCYWHLIGFQLG